MKKTFVYIVMLIGMGLGISSCYSDDSSLDLNPITGVEIDTTGMSQLFVYQFEDLIVEPKFEMGDLSDADLSYEWRINLTPGDTIYKVIGEERNLHYEMDLKPTTSGYFHQLWFTVTDHRHDLDYIMTWPVTVRNNIGEGLVIAETADGVTSDFSHIMAPQVTPDYTQESIKYQIYSTNNERPLEGVVKQMRFTQIFGVDAIMGITDNSVFKIHTFDYTLGGVNNDLFYTNRTTFEPQALGAIVQGDMYVGEGQLTGTYLGAATHFGAPVDAPYTVPDHVAFNAHSYGPAVMVNFYDEVNQHFVYLPTIAAWGDNNVHKAAPAAGAVFNPADLKNKENLAAAVSNTGDFLHLLKDKETGEIALYVLDGGQSGNPAISPAPKALYELSSAPGIDQASHFTFLDDQRVLYYVSGNTIYAMLYGGSTPVFEERFTAPAGQEITTLQVYRQADYPSRSSSGAPYLPTNNRQLIMSTYDGNEGTVYLLPFINTGIGNIDQARIKTFGGFNRITAITTQL